MLLVADEACSGDEKPRAGLRVAFKLGATMKPALTVFAVSVVAAASMQAAPDFRRKSCPSFVPLRGMPWAGQAEGKLRLDTQEFSPQGGRADPRTRPGMWTAVNSSSGCRCRRIMTTTCRPRASP